MIVENTELEMITYMPLSTNKPNIKVIINTQEKVQQQNNTFRALALPNKIFQILLISN